MEKMRFKKKDLVLFIVLALISNYLTIRLSYISGEIINKIYDGSLMVNLPIYILRLLIFIALVMTFLTLKNSYKFHIVGKEVKDFRTRLYTSVLQNDLATFKENDPSYYHNLLYSDTEAIRLNYFTSKLIIIDNIILLLAITSIHPLFLLIALLSTFIPYLIPKLFEKKLDRQRIDYSEKSQSHIAFVKEEYWG